MIFCASPLLSWVDFQRQELCHQRLPKLMKLVDFAEWFGKASLLDPKFHVTDLIQLSTSKSCYVEDNYWKIRQTSLDHPLPSCYDCCSNSFVSSLRNRIFVCIQVIMDGIPELAIVVRY